MPPPTADVPVPRSQADAHRWLEEHGGYLYAVAMRSLRNAGAAEEAVQETLLAGLTAAERFEDRASIRTWLVAILRHKVIDCQRRSARARAFERAASSSNSSEDAHFSRGRWTHKPGGWGADPAKIAQQEEFRHSVRECLEGLAPRAVEAIRLVEQQQNTVSQASKIMDVTPTNLSVMLYRARLALRKCIEDHWHAGRD